MSNHSQFALLKERRFMPFFITQGLGAFNDNIFKNAMVALLVFEGSSLSYRKLNHEAKRFANALRRSKYTAT